MIIGVENKQGESADFTEVEFYLFLEILSQSDFWDEQYEFCILPF